MDIAEHYFRRFGFCERQITSRPPPNLGMVVVVPCFNEPDLVGALASLGRCDRPNCAVEIIVVVNSAADASAEVKTQNRASVEEGREYAHILHFPDLPPKHAGVGLARKIGMDEALRRFADIGNLWEGIIVNYDADCRCDANYLRAIETHFAENQKTPGCSIYFEHLPGPADLYELHLRYYVHALRHAGHPYAFHTIGSCMAVRAQIYMEQGGMNKRKAGEDFYFLQKVMALGNYSELVTTRVMPSSRESTRVPFGTGRAVGNQLRGQPQMTYPLEAFLDLKAFFQDVAKPPVAMRPFLEGNAFDEALREIRKHTATEQTFHDRFFRWFNGFMAMKYIHFGRDQVYGSRPVAAEAARLVDSAADNLLATYRDLQKMPFHRMKEGKS